MICQLKKEAFTLIELLVVIAIIGLVATLAVVGLQNVRQNARDSKRVSDMRQLQTALEVFFIENGRYPTEEEWNSGSISSPSSGSPLMYSIPSSPSPADGDCSEASNTYIYAPRDNGSSYTIDFCTGKQVSDLSAGSKTLTPGGIINNEQEQENVEEPSVIDCSSYVSGSECEYNGHIYKIAQIGGQTWFAENLITTKYNDGQEIPVLQDSTEWSNAGLSSSPASSWVVVGGSTIYDYGLLYNWYAVSNSGQFNLCPVGWRVPSNQDATDLQVFLGNNLHKIKSCCQQDATPSALSACLSPVGGCSRSEHPRWNADATYYGSNEYGTAIVPSGVRWAGGSYNNIGDMARFWTKDSYDASNAYDFSVWYTMHSNIYIRSDGVRNGYSVRCVK